VDLLQNALYVRCMCENSSCKCNVYDNITITITSSPHPQRKLKPENNPDAVPKLGNIFAHINLEPIPQPYMIRGYSSIRGASSPNQVPLSLKKYIAPQLQALAYQRHRPVGEPMVLRNPIWMLLMG
jgi:hypothetical protein